MQTLQRFNEKEARRIFSISMAVGTILLSLIMFAAQASAQKRTSRKSVKAIAAPVKTIQFDALYKDEWLYYGRTADNEWQYYNAYEGRRRGALVRVWTELRQENDKDVLNRIFYELDCSERKIRSLAGVQYYREEKYADGRKEWIKTDADGWDTPNDVFTFIIPHSLGATLLAAACRL